MKIRLNKKWRIVIGSLLGLLFTIAIAAYLIFQSSSVQTYLVQKITDRLSNELNADIEIKGVDIRFFSRLEIEGLLVKDQQEDTLLFAQSLLVNLSDLVFADQFADIQYVGLEGAHANIQRDAQGFKFDFILSTLTQSQEVAAL